MPDLIRATITGFDRCDAEGHTVRAAAPVLAMCRELLAAGYDPRAHYAPTEATRRRSRSGRSAKAPS